MNWSPWAGVALAGWGGGGRGGVGGRRAAELLGGVMGGRVPPFTAVELHDSDLGQLTPTSYQADLVIT